MSPGLQRVPIVVKIETTRLLRVGTVAGYARSALDTLHLIGTPKELQSALVSQRIFFHEQATQLWQFPSDVLRHFSESVVVHMHRSES